MSRFQFFLILYYIIGTVVIVGIAILAGGFVLMLVLVPVHGQTNTTPITNSPTAGVQFIPQQGYIVTIPPANIQSQSTTENGVTPVILSLVSSAGAYIAAKLQGDKKHKENAAEILKGKEVNKELARVTFDMNPEQAAKITDAPSIKIQTLANDVAQYADKVAKK